MTMHSLISELSMTMIFPVPHAELFYVFHSSPISYTVDLQYSSCKHVSANRVGKGVDPDQLASPADLELQCLK